MGFQRVSHQASPTAQLACLVSSLTNGLCPSGTTCGSPPSSAPICLLSSGLMLLRHTPSCPPPHPVHTWGRPTPICVAAVEERTAEGSLTCVTMSPKGSAPLPLSNVDLASFWQRKYNQRGLAPALQRAALLPPPHPAPTHPRGPLQAAAIPIHTTLPTCSFLYLKPLEHVSRLLSGLRGFLTLLAPSL